MGLRDLTLTDVLRIREIKGLVRLEPGEAERFTTSALALITGGTANRDHLLAPLERTRDKIAQKYGADYAADLLARLRL